MKSFVAIGWMIGCFMVIGCRRSDWKTMHVECPPEVTFEQLRHALTTLDRETPPEITADGTQITVRYNAMHIAPRNILYICETFPTATQKEAQP